MIFVALQAAHDPLSMRVLHFDRLLHFLQRLCLDGLELLDSREIFSGYLVVVLQIVKPAHRVDRLEVYLKPLRLLKRYLRLLLYPMSAGLSLLELE